MKPSDAVSRVSARRTGWRWLAAVGFTIGIVGGLAILTPDAAQAQERPRTLMEFLFPGNRPQQPSRLRESERRPSASAPQQRTTPQRTTTRQSTPRAATSAPRTPARTPAPTVTAVEKANDARVLLVIGDFIGGGMAEGLTAAYAEDATIRVVDRTNGSSGFVRDDYFDWPAQIGEILESTTPVAVAVLIGSNDRQQMVVDGSRESPRSDRWNEEYARRAGAVATALAERDIPFVWVGLPPFKATRMSSDMLAFNDIQRTVAETAGGTFVDIWEGFVDEAGAFVTNGPDINGQPARLRAGDGINFTQSGKRKIAFYAEKPLNRILETGAPIPLAEPGFPMPTVEDTPGLFEMGELPPIDRTGPISLDDPEFEGSGELLGLVATPRREEARTPAERLVIEGHAPPARPGRVDDFSLAPLPVAAEPAPAGTGPAERSPETPVGVPQDPAEPQNEERERERTSAIFR